MRWEFGSFALFVASASVAAAAIIVIIIRTAGVVVVFCSFFHLQSIGKKARTVIENISVKLELKWNACLQLNWSLAFSCCCCDGCFFVKNATSQLYSLLTGKIIEQTALYTLKSLDINRLRSCLMSWNSDFEMQCNAMHAQTQQQQ